MVHHAEYFLRLRNTRMVVLNEALSPSPTVGVKPLLHGQILSNLIIEGDKI